MKRVFATVGIAAALVAGGAALTTTASAASVGWCDGVKAVTVNDAGDYVRQPCHKGTGSRNCTLAEGSSGTAVTALQQPLKACNFASNLSTDGEYGPITKKAVAYPQYRHGAATVSRTRRP